VRLAARRGPGGVTLSWVRRTRFGGDSLDLDDPPLNEDGESYRVSIRNGASVVRTLTATAPSCLYTDADEILDFGGAQAGLSIAVSQTSRIAGDGHAAEAIVPVA
jgi:hypothetical protein